MARIILQRRILVTLFLGFSSGLPFAALGSVLQARLTDAGLSLTTIGFLSLVGVPYSIKFLWAPLMDRYTLPFLGRRRGWIIVSQISAALALFALAFADPVESLPLFVVCAVAAAFFSATQDIVLDAHRRDTLADSELGLGSGLFISGYRVAMLAGGAGGLALAQYLPWQLVYLIAAAVMAGMIVFTLFAPEGLEQSVPVTLRAAVIEPLSDFFNRPRVWLILLLVILYRLGDSMAASISTVFFLEAGFSKVQVAAVANTAGMILTISGGVMGGFIGVRHGIYRALWICGLFQAVSTLGYLVLALYPGSFVLFACSAGFESLTNGMGMAAYAGFLLSLCSRRYSATQYALLSSLMAFTRVVLGSMSGWLASELGWAAFFIVCTAVAIPGLMLLRVLKASAPD